MGGFLISMLWLGLAVASGPAREVGPADYDGKFEETAESFDDAPTPGEIDAALGAARRDFPIETHRSEDGLLLPVRGITASQLVDTFTASRSGGRSHGAIDIMAPRGSLVVSASDGIVERLHRSRLGGITVYVRSPDQAWVYYYAHLESYAPGLAEGQRIQRGDPIGRVGSTGNAHPDWPHLHFAMYRMASGARFYQGRPVNPYPLLAGNARRR
jgi:murein DD-endopeptidase MepM/ murein hydrolase activator NlpD